MPVASVKPRTEPAGETPRRIGRHKMETIRIFDTKPYLTECSAEVLSCTETEHEGNKCYAVILDRTVFFPEEGGQSPDKGTINEAEVLDVQVKDRFITHYLAEPVALGTASLKLFWPHRFSNMQQHSGEHIFSGLVHSIFGYDNVGFHLSDNSVTMDFNGILTQEDVVLIEDRVNEAIYKNIEIDARYVDRETLKHLEYRSKKELSGDVRIVTIPGYDICACCAPHVKRTGEIGILKVIRLQNYKGGVRIHILCGSRALSYYRESIGLIDELTDILTTGRENLVESVQSLSAEALALSSKLLSAKTELMNRELLEIPESHQDVLLFREKTDNIIIRNAVNFLTARHQGVVAFFAGDDTCGYSYIIGSATKDVRSVQKKLSEKLGARGGGRPEMVQGSVKAVKKEIEEALG